MFTFMMTILISIVSIYMGCLLGEYKSTKEFLKTLTDMQNEITEIINECERMDSDEK